MMPDDHQHSDTHLTALLTASRGWLRCVIAARLGNTEGADDVLQEVSVAAVEAKVPVREQNASKAWLFQVAVKQSLLFLRRMGRYRRLLGNAAERAAPVDDGGGNPLTWLLSTERRQLIREALQRLSGRDRELLILKYMEEWSYREIAEVRGSTERAIESRVCRARERLREHLKHLDVIEDGPPETSQQ